MPIPILVGIGAAVTAIISELTLVFTKKTLVAAALVSALAICYTALFVKATTYTSQIPVPAGASWITVGVQLLPSNIDECIILILSFEACKMMFQAAMKVIDIRASS